MYCNIDGIRIYYEVAGSGKPVVMIHGWGLDHHVMRGCMEPVFKRRHGYKRIYFDLPGHGRTSSGCRLQNSDHMLELVIDFIRRRTRNRSFLVAGESYGGYLARGLAYHMPERIDGMLLICPVVVPEHHERALPERLALVRDDALMDSLEPFERENLEMAATVLDRETWRRFRKEMLPGALRENPAFADRFQQQGYPFSVNVDDGTQFDKPTLILTGRQDTEVGYVDHLKLVDRYPRGTFAILDRAGHALPIEQDQTFNALVNEWLDRVEE